MAGTTPKKTRGTRIGRLTSAALVGIEIARLYRKCRVKELDLDEGVKLCRMLDILRGCLDQGEVEKRLAEIENRVASAVSVSGVVPFKRTS